MEDVPTRWQRSAPLPHPDPFHTHCALGRWPLRARGPDDVLEPGEILHLCIREAGSRIPGYSVGGRRSNAATAPAEGAADDAEVEEEDGSYSGENKEEHEGDGHDEGLEEEGEHPGPAPGLRSLRRGGGIRQRTGSRINVKFFGKERAALIDLGHG